jgi:hypothetical protein
MSHAPTSTIRIYLRVEKERYMIKNSKRRNLGLLLAFSMLVLATALGFGARSSSQQAAVTAPTGGHQASLPNRNVSGSVPASAAGATSRNDPHAIRVVVEDKHDTSIALRDMPPAAPVARHTENEQDQGLHGAKPYVGSSNTGFIDPVLQKSFGPLVMPTPLITFEGLGANGSIPPDTNGDIGPNHYVQWINTQFAVYNRAGTRVLGPLAGNTLFAGFGGPCQTTNDGDPITLYDQLADRWLMSQFALPNYPNGPFYQCIAISQTGDPTGSWHRYQFTTSANKLNDYPHFGVWPDAYYMTANLFDTSSNWAGTGNYAFDRTRMLAGQAATMQLHELGIEDWGGMLPSDLDGTTLPPSGAPNTFIEVNADEWSFPPYTYHDELQIWQFHVDWVTPANTTFTGPVLRPVAAFDGIACPNFTRSCIRQPGTGNRVDAITDRGFYRLAYRNFGDHESLVINSTVDVDGNDQGHTGIRWYEVRSPRSGPVVYQQGTYAPDASSRWMGSAAMDHNGNMAIGYSISNATDVYPGIRYAGRLSTDPLGQLSQGEATLIAGAGSQTGYDRWGDYSMMSVDPTDDCTFWYTQEYYPSTSGGGFHTRIGSFKFPSCTSGGPTNTPAATSTTGPATATRTPTATPACGATPPWTSASPVPTARGRAAGATIGNNVYVFGGRPDGTTYAQTVYIYNTAANTWQLSSATLPDAMTSNMGAGVLTFPEGQRVFIVGGSGTGSVLTGRTLAFNPADGTFTPKAAWPAAPTRLPGGWAVANNKLYVFGGFVPTPAPGVVYAETWMYDPTANTWTQVTTANLSLARAYIATETMPNGLIYLAGGSAIDTVGATLTDETAFDMFNPATGTMATGPAMLEPKGNNHGYLYDGKFYVPGGGFLAANHNTHVQIFNPATSSWSLGTDIVSTSRNYAKGYGTDGSLYMLGGLDTGATAWYDYNQKLAAPQGCTTPTPGPTNTVGPTNTPGGASPTPCPITFSDVHPSDYFYVSVQYLACHGVISGYADGTFRPFNNTTRGQLTKIVVLAEGWTQTCTSQTFSDVPPSHTFYCYVETAVAHGVISGYADGTFKPGNDVTRGQLAKIVVLAEGWTQTCTTQHFSDVPPTHPFYCFVETAFAHGIISGYADGTFRPGNSATRGQISKIVYEAITQP